MSYKRTNDVCGASLPPRLDYYICNQVHYEERLFNASTEKQEIKKYDPTFLSSIVPSHSPLSLNFTLTCCVVVVVVCWRLVCQVIILLQCLTAASPMSSVLYCESLLINKIFKLPQKLKSTPTSPAPEKDRNLFYSFTVRSTFISIDIDTP